jgi:hypothetical protein
LQPLALLWCQLVQLEARLGDFQGTHRGVQANNLVKLPVAEQFAEQVPFATAQIEHTACATLE